MEPLWADFHTHATGHRADPEELDDVLEYAREHLDAVTVLCYPFEYERRGSGGGVVDESVGTRPAFEADWERVNAASAAHNDPGAFVALPGYEWHGDRTRWGDHNVLYRGEGGPLDDEPELPELYDNLRTREPPALALPHHTGYRVGNRGKDWDCFDPALSPVMEVYSGHGSSEAVDEPPRMENLSMGPRVSGGTLQDGLAAGCRVGVVAGNDGWGVPGTPWDDGVTGVWAEDCTREAVWGALRERRTFGVSGDRIALDYEVGGAPMGSVADLDAPTVEATVDCPRPLDIVEVLGDGRVLATHVHRPHPAEDPDGRYRLPVEMGWGPTRSNGDFDDVTLDWRGHIDVDDGALARVWPRFDGMGQRYAFDGDCAFECRSARDRERPQYDPGPIQGFVVEVAGADATLVLDLDRGRVEVPIAAAREGARVVAFEDEARERIERAVGAADEIRNPDTLYQHSPRVRVGRATPRAACRASPAFEVPDCGYYYLRARQVNGHRAWGSPVWSS